MFRRNSVTITGIQILPNELLSRVFLCAAQQDTSDYDATVVPIILSHVCGRWREVALSAGSLWANILITFPTSQSQMSRTIAALDRSRVYALEILLDLRDPSWDWQEESHGFRWQDMESILRLLLPHITRWRRIEVLTDTWAPIFTFLWHTKRESRATQLERISLSRCNAFFVSRGQTFQPESMAQPIQLFNGDAPALHEVILSGVHIDWATSPLKALVELQLKYHARDVMPTLQQFMAMLQACPELEKLAIVGWGPQLEDADTGPGSMTLANQGIDGGRPIRLDSLKIFILGFVDSEYAIWLLSLFAFPVLQDLSIEDVTRSLDPTQQEDATSLIESLSSCLRADRALCSDRCCCSCRIQKVTHLELNAIDANQDKISHFLGRLAALRTLRLRDASHGVLSALFAFDVSSGGRAGLTWPSSSKLELSGKVNHDTFVELVSARSKTNLASLPAITLVLPEAEKNDSNLTTELRERLVRAGVTVRG